MKSKEASGYRNNVKVCHQSFNLWKFQVPSNLIIFSAKGNKGQFEVSSTFQGCQSANESSEVNGSKPESTGSLKQR